MSNFQTCIMEENEDTFNSETGEITHQSRRKVHKSKIEPTDEFIKVSKYLNTIFAYNNIPLNLVPISLLIAQRMQFKTNIVYLLKDDKEEMCQMLGVKLPRLEQLIRDLRLNDIIRPVPNSRGKYVVNGFLFSTGDTLQTRDLQASFNFDTEEVIMSATHKLINGDLVKRAVKDSKSKKVGMIPGQMSLEDFSHEN